MTDEFSSAGIALEQFINVVESDEESASNPTNVELPTEPTPPIDQATTKLKAEIEETPDDEPLNETSILAMVEQPEQTIESEEQSTTDVQSAPVNIEAPKGVETFSGFAGIPPLGVTSFIEENINKSERGPIESPNTDAASTAEVPEDILEQSDEELFNEGTEYLPEQSTLTYGDKEEMDFGVYNTPLKSKVEEEMVSLQAQPETSNQSEDDVETSTKSNTKSKAKAAEVGKVIGMISDKVTYVHRGMRVTQREQRSSDEIGILVSD